jgi:hypothetical protein
MERRQDEKEGELENNYSQWSIVPSTSLGYYLWVYIPF